MKVTRDWMGFTTVEDNNKKVTLANHIFKEVFRLTELLLTCSDIERVGVEEEQFSIKAEREELGILLTIRQNKSIMVNDNIYRRAHAYDIIFVDNNDMGIFISQSKNNIPEEEQ
ncbi:MAG: hypothetical protein ACRCXX_13980 [Cetobacterium sp.]|uniref:hypothetical protein n=1 Tax=Cetobacterium sp. TaxID=2071632 RepID=UPI003F37DC51